MQSNSLLQIGGAGGNCTHAWGFCRPLPYYLATAPEFLLIVLAHRSERHHWDAPAGRSAIAKAGRPSCGIVLRTLSLGHDAPAAE